MLVASGQHKVRYLLSKLHYLVGPVFSVDRIGDYVITSFLSAVRTWKLFIGK